MGRLHWNLLLGWLASLALAGVLVFSLANQAERMEERRSAAAARQIEAGAEIYMTNCTNCHGGNGEGIGELGPALNDAHFFNGRLAEIGWQGTLVEYIQGSTAFGRVTATRPLYAGDGHAVVMSPWAQEQGGPLRPDEVEAVTAFVMNWQAGAEGAFLPPVVIMPTLAPQSNSDQVQRGQTAFVEVGCSACHTPGEDVAGPAAALPGPSLAGIGAAAANRLPGYAPEAYLRESILIPGAYRVDGYPADVLCGGVLSQSQLADLVAYLLTLK